MKRAIIVLLAALLLTGCSRQTQVWLPEEEAVELQGREVVRIPMDSETEPETTQMETEPAKETAPAETQPVIAGKTTITKKPTATPKKSSSTSTTKKETITATGKPVDTEPLATEPPVTEPPVTKPPVTEPPVTEPPVTEPPVTEPPVTEPPVTEPPVTEPPVTEPAPTVRTGKVKVNSVLRVRSGPGTSYGVAGYLYNNNQVTITEQTTVGSTTWGKTDKGWVSMEYIVLDQTSSGSQSAPVQKVTGTVTAKQPLRIRSGAGTSYSIVGYLKSNARVEILEQKTVNGMVWGRVSKGWISMDYIALDGGQPPVAEKPQSTVKTVTASCLRVRSAAGTNNSIVGYLYSGSKVEILETQTVNGTVWGRISKGWISMDYVK